MEHHKGGFRNKGVTLRLGETRSMVSTANKEDQSKGGYHGKSHVWPFGLTRWIYRG